MNGKNWSPSSMHTVRPTSIITVTSTFLALVMAILSQGCSYRFSNEAMKSPAGLRNLAIEAVYDTGEEVLPHHLLWGELFRSFVARGKMRITSVDDADLLVRAHIFKSESLPGNLRRDTVIKDKFHGNDIFKTTSVQSQFKNLLRAGSWTTSQSLSMKVNIEVWNLKTHQKIFERSYDGGGGFLSFRANSSTNIMSQFLQAEESRYNSFRQTSRMIAEKVVSDLLL